MADDLNLNSVSRFSKQSPRLHLEEHGHCEVPAGCGGVVLRWYNPAQSVPVLLHAYMPCPPVALSLNGVTPISARPLVPPGRVVLAIEFNAVTPRQAVLMFAAGRPADGRYEISEELGFVFLSAPDGSWRFSSTPPPDGWMLPTFDDSRWPELVERPLDRPRNDDYRNASEFRRLTKLGARPIGLPPEHGRIVHTWIRRGANRPTRVWVRGSFTLPQELKR